MTLNAGSNEKEVMLDTVCHSISAYAARREELEAALSAMWTADSPKFWVNLDSLFLQLSANNVEAGIRQEISVIDSEIERLREQLLSLADDSN